MRSQKEELLFLSEGHVEPANWNAREQMHFGACRSLGLIIYSSTQVRHQDGRQESQSTERKTCCLIADGINITRRTTNKVFVQVVEGVFGETFDPCTQYHHFLAG